MRRKVTSQTHKNIIQNNILRKIRAYRIGDRAQAGTVAPDHRPRGLSISNRRSRSSRNAAVVAVLVAIEHIESEIALKPEQRGLRADAGHGAYRIGDRAQAGTKLLQLLKLEMSISNRRSRSSRNVIRAIASSGHEHIESEIALKPER